MLLAVLVLALSVPPDAEEITITLDCSRMCSDEAPQTQFDYPKCEDYDLNTSLMEALERNDRSARALLGRRFFLESTLMERHRIAGALIGHPDDAPYWKELERHAAIAVRFDLFGDEEPPEFMAWCVERHLDPYEYKNVALYAFFLAAVDARMRPLLRAALASKDPRTIETAVTALGLQQDHASLPLIEQAIERFPNDVHSTARALAAFRSPEAERIAFRFLAENERGEYYEMLSNVSGDDQD